MNYVILPNNGCANSTSGTYYRLEGVSGVSSQNAGAVPTGTAFFIMTNNEDGQGNNEK